MSCSYCQSHMVAYIHHQLSPRKRRLVAQHLQGCATCYGHYSRQRDLAQELRASVPLVGTPTAPQLGRIWLSVQRDMARAEPVRRRSLGRYGWAVFILALMLALPWSMGKHEVALAVPPQPSAPVVLRVTQSPATAPAEVTEVAMASATDPVIPPAETPLIASSTPDIP